MERALRQSRSFGKEESLSVWHSQTGPHPEALTGAA